MAQACRDQSGSKSAVAISSGSATGLFRGRKHIRGDVVTQRFSRRVRYWLPSKQKRIAVRAERIPTKSVRQRCCRAKKLAYHYFRMHYGRWMSLQAGRVFESKTRMGISVFPKEHGRTRARRHGRNARADFRFQRLPCRVRFPGSRH